MLTNLKLNKPEALNFKLKNLSLPDMTLISTDNAKNQEIVDNYTKTNLGTCMVETYK